MITHHDRVKLHFVAGSNLIAAFSDGGEAICDLLAVRSSGHSLEGFALIERRPLSECDSSSCWWVTPAVPPHCFHACGREYNSEVTVSIQTEDGSLVRIRDMDGLEPFIGPLDEYSCFDNRIVEIVLALTQNINNHGYFHIDSIWDQRSIDLRKEREEKLRISRIAEDREIETSALKSQLQRVTHLLPEKEKVIQALQQKVRHLEETVKQEEPTSMFHVPAKKNPVSLSKASKRERKVLEKFGRGLSSTLEGAH